VFDEDQPAPDARAAAIPLVAWADPLTRYRAFQAALSDAEPTVRAGAIERLAAGLGEAALPLVAQALADDDERVRAAAAAAIPPGGVAVGPIWDALAGAAPPARPPLVAALARADRTQVLLRIERAATDADPAQRAAAATVAGHVAPDAADRLAGALADPAAAVRAAAVEALAALGTGEAVSAASRALVDPEPGVRLAAVRALAGVDTDAAVAAVVTALRDPAPLVQGEARAVLSGRASPAVARHLVRALGAMATRGAAVELLAAMPDLALDALLDAVPAATAEQEGPLGDALGAVAGDGVARLAARLGAIDPARRRAAVAALGLLRGVPPSDVVAQLVAALADADVDTRVAAARALARAGDPAAAEPLRARLLAEPAPEVVEAVKQALASLGERGEAGG
jgi:HEAT repeat protein